MLVFGTDKIQHFFAGLFIYFLLDFLGSQLDVGLTSFLIIILVLFAGIGKEVLDKLNGRDVEILDVAATVLGGLSAMALSSLAISD